MKIDTTYLSRCIDTLEQALGLLNESDPELIAYDMYRSACVKEFEIILEQSGKLLRKALKPYFHSSKAVDELFYKEVFRQAVLRNLITDETCQRWLEYRDNRNNTAHDYGEGFAEETIQLLPKFIEDARNLVQVINQTTQSANDN